MPINMNKIIHIARKVFYPIFIISVISRIAIVFLDLFECQYLPLGHLIFKVLFSVLVFSFLTILISNFQTFGVLKGIGKLILKFVALMFCFFLFTNLSSRGVNVNRIRLNILNETEYEVSEFQVSYSSGITKITTPLGSKQSKKIIVYPTINRNNTKNDAKAIMILKYYCNGAWRDNVISIESSKWRLVDKCAIIKINSPDSVELVK